MSYPGGYEILGDMMKRVLVTGGAGFIGPHLCQRLLQEGYGVICLDNFDAYSDPPIKRRNLEEIRASRGAQGFHLMEGDIRDKGLLDDFFRRSSFDSIIHLAARAGVDLLSLYASPYS